VLGGARTRPYLIDTRGQRHVVGATFIAGGARPFFGAPVDELRGEHIPLDAIWGRYACAIRERLLDAPTVASRLRVLETILLERRVGPLEREAAVDLALACLTDRTRAWRIAEVRDRLGMSATRFIRIFAEHVGLTPKRFARLHRFQRAVAGLETAPYRRLAALAVDCGYSDQAHFIHEFRAFAGVTPTDYVARRSVPTHVRIDQRKIYNPARLGTRTIAT
jgi:AraC-like DNA-binding protein